MTAPHVAGPVFSTFLLLALKSETLTDFTGENKVRRHYLTKEYKFSKMLLEKFEYGEVDLSIATKESLSAERPFPLQRPDVDLFLAVSECAMAWIPTLLLGSDV